MTTWIDSPGTITTGQYVKETVVQNSLYNNLSLASVVLARKTADESVTSNVTPQDDNDLFFAVASGELWCVRFIFKVKAGGAVAVGFKVQFSGPIDSYILMTSSAINSGGNMAMMNWVSTDGLTNTQAYEVVSTTPDLYVAQGLVYTAALGGTFKLKWAQDSSSATATTLMIGSCVLGTRLGANPSLP